MQTLGALATGQTLQPWLETSRSLHLLNPVRQHSSTEAPSFSTALCVPVMLYGHHSPGPTERRATENPGRKPPSRSKSTPVGSSPHTSTAVSQGARHAHPGHTGPPVTGVTTSHGDPAILDTPPGGQLWGAQKPPKQPPNN